jgi:hypothetical protein
MGSNHNDANQEITNIMPQSQSIRLQRNNALIEITAEIITAIVNSHSYY